MNVYPTTRAGKIDFRFGMTMFRTGGARERNHHPHFAASGIGWPEHNWRPERLGNVEIDRPGAIVQDAGGNPKQKP